jgi:hypothetical protein
MVSTVYNIKTDSLYSFNISNAKKTTAVSKAILFNSLFQEEQIGTFEKHQEDEYEDFYYQKNVPQSVSKEGPKMAIGDVNGDGLEDVFMCGAKGQISQLYIQKNGSFYLSQQKDFERFNLFEDTAAEFFDADKDGDLDLYVGAGGNEFKIGDRFLMDRIYLNDGRGNFVISGKSLPNTTMNTSVIVPLDYDSDGDLDLFVGSRSYPQEYGYAPFSYIFENNGKGIFKDVTQNIAKGIIQVGMVRDAIFEDIDGDKKKELIVIGDWMSPKVFKLKNRKFVLEENSLNSYNGFWGSILAVDIDNDKDLDLVLGNMGENFPLYPDSENPLKIWVGDFDKNGINDKILTKTVNEKEVPVFLKREMMEQFPFLKAQTLKHSDYATKTIYDFFKADILNQGYSARIDYLSSVVAKNDGKGNFTISKLPTAAQLSCINAMEKLDANLDGYQDILIGGNNYGFIPQFSRQDASRGLLLMNNKKGGFYPLKQRESGFILSGEIKQISKLIIGDSNKIIALINNQKPKIFSLNSNK